jgi:hypothetical protein
VQPAVVVPVDPLEGGQLDVVEAALRSAPADQLGPEQPEADLSEGVVQLVGGVGTFIDRDIHGVFHIGTSNWPVTAYVVIHATALTPADAGPDRCRRESVERTRA